ncbi:methyl-accepting chemotaxis protein [Paenibacillus albidus]|uniref:methyl-accepting chemotaxis protein n=1 Tax=Paenibacillus albidus TaxID=2041023 RepID=UPI001BEA9DEA|nr:methyl-accepting chemotaxis protein [Paenibacillus albidus]MBT2292872.1 methyl-accepting chemotaxis protein [Paenibacillus albidus]
MKKKKFRFTVRIKLMLSFVLILLVPSLTMGVIATDSSRSGMEQQMLSSTEQSVETVNSIVSNQIQSKMNDADFLTKLFKSTMINGPRSPQIVPQLEQYLSMHADVNDIYIGTPDGLMIRGKAKDDTKYDPRERDWYKLAMATPGKISITPVIINTSGNAAIVIAKTLEDGSGALGISLSLDALRTLTDIHIGKEGYVVVLDGYKKVVVHPELKPSEEGDSSYAVPMFAKETGRFDYQLDGRDKKMLFVTNELTGWKIGGSLYLSEIHEGADQIQTKIYVTVAIILAVMLVLSQVIVNSITGPLRRLQESAAAISKGDLTIHVDTRKHDEIGNVARSFQNMVDNLRAMIMGVQESTEMVSASAEELASGSEETSKAIEHVSESVQELATGSEQQAGRVQQGTESMEQISGEIRNLSGRMQEMSTGMLETSASAQAGNEAAEYATRQIYSVQETVERLDSTVVKLGERSLEIDSIVEVIAGISRQTNLLALNASIEAARAGEHGRGFAVVAEEVRKLAFSSEQSANQISELIQAVRLHIEEVETEMKAAKAKVTGGIEAVNGSGRSFAEITEKLGYSSSALETLAGTAQEMTEAAAVVSAHMEEIRSISAHSAEITDSVSAATQQQLASSEEIASSAAGLSNMAEQLQQLVLRFKIYDHDNK